MISNKELISLIKEDVLETAKKIKAQPDYPSTVIAYSIWLYNNKLIDDDVILDKNNILGVHKENGEFAEFSTIQQGLLMETNEVMPEEFNNEYKSICIANKLHAIDKAYAYSMNNAIDLTAEQKKPNIDQYTVKSDIGAVVAKTSTLEEAKQVAETTDSKATIVNSMGDVVEKVSNVAKPIHTDEVVSFCKQAKSRIDIQDINLYASSKSSIPSRLISGTFYLYDGIEYYGKLAICVKPDSSSLDDIIGFVRADQI